MLNGLFESSLLPDNIDRNTLIAGVDEVGRGALFGSVVAAAVLLPLSAIPHLTNLGINDSKKLTARKRQQLIKPIESVVTDCQIAEATVAEIDELNILHASLLAMKRAILALEPVPEFCFIDGQFLIPNLAIAQYAVVKGDSRSLAIAAASILAKVWRDDLITRLAPKYPEYDLARNKGYPTAKHQLALQNYGVSSQHRKSFAPCRRVLKKD